MQVGRRKRSFLWTSLALGAAASLLLAWLFFVSPAGAIAGVEPHSLGVVPVEEVSIYDVQQVADPATDGDSPYLGATVAVTGVVTSEPGEIDASNRAFFIEHPNGGPWSGLLVYYYPGFDALSEGDLVTVTGEVDEYYDMTELKPVNGSADVQLISSGNPVPAAEVIDTGDFVDADTAEQWESVLIEFQDAEVVNPDLGYGEWSFDDGSGTTGADDLGEIDGDLTYVPEQDDVYDFIRGIGYYSFSAYKLEPRSDADIRLKAVAPKLSKQAPLLVAPGDPFTYTLTLRNPFAYDLTDVTISDTVPANTTFARALDGGVQADGTVNWDVGTLPSLGSVDVRFVVTASLETAEAINDGYAIVATNFVTPTFGAPVLTVIGDAVEIHNIQGSGEASLLEGETVDDVQGIVTALYYKDENALQVSGFFMQDPTPDADPQTSDGIFVYTGSDPGLAVGDEVFVSATVDEYYGLTQLASPSIVKGAGSATIAPMTLDLPIPAGTTLEPYEGVLVTLPETLTVSQNYFLGRYGQLTLSADGRMYNPTNGNDLGDTLDLDQRRMIVLDDGKSAQNPEPVPYLGLNGTVRAGDTTSGVTGVIDYGLITSDASYYRLQPTKAVHFTRVNERSASPADVGGSLKVASFNVLNYFNGPDFPTSRGADTPQEFERQRTKIITAVLSLDADVVGLMEIENDGDGPDSAIQDLVNGLNDVAGEGTYDLIPDPDFIGTDEIKVALIYKPGAVTPVGDSMSDDDAIFDRPPVGQIFQANDNGAVFSVVVNHFKSKGSCPVDPADPNADYGQGCWNVKRVEQAQALLGFIDDLKTTAADPDVLVIGDLNSYGEEDPVLALTDGGLVNEVAAWVPATERYSYVFDGLAGYLDHGLATTSLDGQVTGVTFWHINADEPAVLDYDQDYNPAGLYQPDAYRASDHDPVLVGLDLVFFDHSLHLPLMLQNQSAPGR
ncbi:MAG: ExeM/NucH family extracellular endonuclease [Anaerolineales bacterium]